VQTRFRRRWRTGRETDIWRNLSGIVTLHAVRCSHLESPISNDWSAASHPGASCPVMRFFSSSNPPKAHISVCAPWVSGTAEPAWTLTLYMTFRVNPAILNGSETMGLEWTGGYADYHACSSSQEVKRGLGDMGWTQKCKAVWRWAVVGCINEVNAKQ